jgi:DNA-binding beta-propeller fold protein YncE
MKRSDSASRRALERWQVRASTVALVGLFACAPDAGTQEPIHAFPNRRPKLIDGKLLGYVANNASDSISVIDLEQMELLGEAPVGRDPVDIDGPSPLSIDQASGLGYTAVAYPQSVVGAHEQVAGAQGRNGYVLALDLVDLAPVGETRVEIEPSNIAFDRASGRLAVSHSDSARALNVAAPVEERRATVGLMNAEGLPRDSTQDLDQDFVPACVVPGALEFGDGGKRLYVACTGEDRLGIIDTGSKSVVAFSPTGSRSFNKPVALVVGAPGILVSNEVSRSVALLSQADTPELLVEVFLQGIPRFGLFTSDKEILVPVQATDGLVRIDLESASVVQEVHYAREDCEAPASLSQHKDELWLVCESDHYRPGRLVRLDPESLEVESGVTLGLFPSRMAVYAP